MKSFTYLGLEFTPEATLKGKETSFYNITKRISCNLKDTPNGWNYNKFYKVAKEHGCGDFDTFKVNGKNRMPGNYLFYYN